MDKNKKPVYYTTAKTYRLIITLILSIGINVLLMEITPDNSFLWFLVIYHGYLLAWAASYALEGIDCPKVKRLKLICITEVLTAVMAILNKKAELITVTGIFFIMAIVFYFFIKTGKMNGDNNSFDHSELDGRWFDIINDAIYRVKVSFPLNIENYRYDRGQGYVIALGLILNNKHPNNYGALITSSANGKKYLCPLRQIKPLEIPAGTTNTGITIARKDGIVEIVCYSWKTGEKADGAIYELAIKDR